MGSQEETGHLILCIRRNRGGFLSVRTDPKSIHHSTFSTRKPAASLFRRESGENDFSKRSVATRLGISIRVFNAHRGRSRHASAAQNRRESERSPISGHRARTRLPIRWLTPEKRNSHKKAQKSQKRSN